MNRGYLPIGLIIALLCLTLPELMAWVLVAIVFTGALIWSAREMRPAPHVRRIVGRTVRNR